MVGTVIAKVSGSAAGATYTMPATDGTADDHLKTDGSGNLAWVAESVGGKVLQLLEDNLNTSVSTTSTSYVASGLSIAITPASIASRFLLTLSGGLVTTSTVAHLYVDTTFYVGGSEVSDAGPYATHRQSNAAAQVAAAPHSSSMIHSPGSVSAQTYTVYYKASGGTAYFNVSPARVVFTVTELSS